MERKRFVFHIVKVPFSEADAHGCVRLYQKEVSSSEDMVRSEDDRGEFIGNFWDKYKAFDKIDELTKDCYEWATFQ